MTVKIESIFNTVSATGIKALIYGRAGSGKTVLCSTAPKPLIISAEDGLLSIKKVIEDKRAAGQPNYDLPAIRVTSLKDLNETYNWIVSDKAARQFQTFCLDSISEIAETIIATEKRKSSNIQQAYGYVADEIIELFRRFRSIKGPNVIFIAKEATEKIGINGKTRVGPLLVGKQLPAATPYLFDLTLNLFIGQDETGKEFRALKTQLDSETEAKDRSGRLAPIEYPDLTYIINKALGRT